MSNALEIQIGIDPVIAGGGEATGGWAVDKGQGGCVLHSLIPFVKKENMGSVLNHITEGRRGRRWTARQEKHFSPLMQTNHSPEPKDSHYLGGGKRPHVC